MRGNQKGRAPKIDGNVQQYFDLGLDTSGSGRREEDGVPTM